VEQVNVPCGIQVARTESLRLRLLKAVLIPMTIKYFLFILVSSFFKFSDMEKPSITDSCAALPSVNFISNFDIVLSSVLHIIYNNKV
jgi:transcriptional regulator of nitric oxide reductase